jgi:hypothetical protein
MIGHLKKSPRRQRRRPYGEPRRGAPKILFKSTGQILPSYSPAPVPGHRVAPSTSELRVQPTIAEKGYSQEPGFRHCRFSDTGLPVFRIGGNSEHEESRGCYRPRLSSYYEPSLIPDRGA